MKRLALYLLLLSGLLLTQFAAGAEDKPRTPRFEPSHKGKLNRKGDRTRTPKTSEQSATDRPKYGRLWTSYNPFNDKPSPAAPSVGGGNGLVEAGEFKPPAGLGGLQSTQFTTTPHAGTSPQRNSEFLKGKSKHQKKKMRIVLRKFRGNICTARLTTQLATASWLWSGLFVQIEVCM